MFCYWRKAGYSYFAHSYVVYLYFISHYGLSGDHLYDTGILDEYQAIYSFCKKESPEVFIEIFLLFNLHRTTILPPGYLLNNNAQVKSIDLLAFLSDTTNTL